MSDQEVADVLKTQGIQIARRTVAKYREELGVLSSGKRKREW
jgi:RNA polymerase sigma-54 factor